MFAHKVKSDPDLWYENPPERPQKAGSGWWDERHNFRLATAKRWLARQVGREWAAVWSDISNLKKRRGGWGAKKIMEFFLWEVELRPKQSPRDWNRPGDLYVDKDGILRQEPRVNKRRCAV